MNKKGPWYLNQSPLGAAYIHFSHAASQSTVLDAKTKELIRVAVASVLRCPHCTEHHIRNAFEAGATKEEITEAILLTSLQSAGTQLNWNREMFEELLGEKESVLPNQ